MKDFELKEKIKGILEECGIELLDYEEDEELGIDSMQYVSLIIQLEDYFNIIIDDEYIIEKDITLREIIEMVRKYVDNKS